MSASEHVTEIIPFLLVCRYARLHAVESFQRLVLRAPQAGVEAVWPLVVYREPRIFVHERSFEHQQVHSDGSQEAQV